MSVLLTATFTRLDGTPASGTVRVTPSRSPIMDPEGQIIISGPQMFPLQADGSISISLPASDDPLLGEAFTYTVVASMDHANWRITGLTLPVGSVTVDLSDPPSGIVREYPTRAEWEAIVDPVLGAAEAAAGRAEFAAEEAEATILAQGDWTGAVDLTGVAARPNYVTATLTGNTTIALPTPAAGRAFTVTLDVLVMLSHPEQSMWTEGSHDALTLRHCCYWKSIAGADPSETRSDLSVRVNRECYVSGHR